MIVNTNFERMWKEAV